MFSSLRKSLILAAISLAVFSGTAQSAPRKAPAYIKGPAPAFFNDAAFTGSISTRDGSYKAIFFDVISILPEDTEDYSLLGWTYNKFILKGVFEKGQYKGYVVCDNEIKIGLDIVKIHDAADRRGIPPEMYERMVEEHEVQHRWDYEKYPLAAFLTPSPVANTNAAGNQPGNTSWPSQCSCDSLAGELCATMEARAMCAELRTITFLYKSAANDITRYENNLATLEELQQKLRELGKDRKSRDQRKELNKQIDQLKKEIKNGKSRYDEITHCTRNGQPVILTAADYLRLAANAEDDMLARYGNAKVRIGTKTYREAYEDYKKKNFAANVIEQQYEEAQQRIDSCLMAIGEKTSELNYNQNYIVKGRPACHGCLMRDPIGKCSYTWCTNNGNKHSEFIPQPGDYCPSSYETKIFRYFRVERTLSNP